MSHLCSIQNIFTFSKLYIVHVGGVIVLKIFKYTTEVLITWNKKVFLPIYDIVNRISKTWALKTWALALKKSEYLSETIKEESKRRKSYGGIIYKYKI